MNTTKYTGRSFINRRFNAEIESNNLKTLINKLRKEIKGLSGFRGYIVCQNDSIIKYRRHNGVHHKTIEKICKSVKK